MGKKRHQEWQLQQQYAAVLRSIRDAILWRGQQLSVPDRLLYAHNLPLKGV
jgi:hypothetical protein